MSAPAARSTGSSVAARRRRSSWATRSASDAAGSASTTACPSEHEPDARAWATRAPGWSPRRRRPGSRCASSAGTSGARATLKKSERTVTVVPGWRIRSSIAASEPPAATIARARPSRPPRTVSSSKRRHRRDARQRLAAEAEGRHAHEVVGRADLAGRVAVERQQRVLAAHPVPVVGDPHERLAAGLDLDGDRPAPARRRAFSSSSFTTEAGRSTTSPAAMRLATTSERMAMRRAATGARARSAERPSAAARDLGHRVVAVAPPARPARPA